MEDFLTNLYIENNFPAKVKLLKLAKETRPEIKAKDVNDFLDALMSYQLLKEAKNRKTSLGHIVAFRINEIWQIDIYDLSRYEKSNKGYNYMFAVVDVFTRFAYIVPMKNKDILSTTLALEEVINYNKNSPDLVMSDNDASFLGDKFQKLLVKHNIHHDPNAVGDHNALGIVDNFAKRIKRILTAQFLHTQSKNWIDNIQKIIRTYNASPHRSLDDISPVDAMSGDKDITQYLFLINLYKSQKNSTVSDLSVDDLVRIKISGDFKKGTDPRYSNTVHIVKTINGKNIILDNDKKYVRANLLKVPAGTVSIDKPNIIDVAKKQKKVSRMLKANDHTDKLKVAQLRRQRLPRKAKENN